ncbi:hypothetical protein [Salmonirosea aquatica]|uniref:Carboxypeptidase regulatory-like domain-containing protein n=1 Tax=Salmonirosea aquatica TaxID=2654236 RepID=A0A7C9BE12_9BACT|nr:hypothetical protein [Cytophagaceae bacterium SJW1-29]
MKRSNYLIQLDNPCSESWDSMTPTPTGRFCQNCTKNVIDFTGLSDDQVLAILKKSKGTLCGRVEETQLNRYLISRTESSFSTRLFKALAGLFLLTTTKSLAQEPIVKQPRALVQTPTGWRQDAVSLANNPDYALKVRLQARLISSETQKPAPNALVALMLPPRNGYSRSVSVTTSDAEGFFEMTIPDSLVDQSTKLAITHVDFARQSIPLRAGAYPEVIELLPPPPIVKVSGGGLMVVKRKWWQRRKKNCS